MARHGPGECRARVGVVAQLDITADAKGAVPQALAFMKFLDTYDITSVQVGPVA